MSGFMRFQVTIPMISGAPEDGVVNVWHFDSDQTFAEDADDVVGRLRTFYQAIDGVVLAQQAGNATVKVYDLADPEPRVPGLTDTIVLSPGAGTSIIPAEVAMCLSMACDPISGVSPGRLRGRIFLGPIRESALTNDGNRAEFTIAAMTTVANAAAALAVGPDAGDGRLAVYSPTTHAELGGAAGALPDAFNDVTRVWVDNAPDTIRSRGIKADSRVTVNI